MKTVPEDTTAYLRRMTEADLETVYSIEKASFSDPWAMSCFVHEVSRNRYTCPLVLVVESEGREVIAGYIILWFLGDELHIANLAVRVDQQGRGWGERMVRAALYLGARWNASYALLEVRRSNNRARQLYHKLGFDLMHIRSRYYSRPLEDALVLRLSGPFSQRRSPVEIRLEEALKPGA